MGNKIKEDLKPEEKTKEDLVMLEAALYVAGRPLELKTLGHVIGSRSKKKIERLMKMLTDLYSQQGGALEIVELENKRYVLQLKPKFSLKVRRLAIRPLLTDGPLKTLSYIAYRQPVAQKQVADVRGRHAYGHMKQLVDMGLVEVDRSGRGNILRTTNYFADFFGLSQNSQRMKRQLKKIFSEIDQKTNSNLKEQSDTEEDRI